MKHSSRLVINFAEINLLVLAVEAVILVRLEIGDVEQVSRMENIPVEIFRRLLDDGPYCGRILRYNRWI